MYPYFEIQSSFNLKLNLINMVNQQFNDSERRNPIISLFQSNTAKIIMVCMLTLGLLIPLEFVKDLIRERAARKHDVVQEVNQMWGSEVKFYGPALKIPYNSSLITTEIDETTGKSRILKQISTNFFYLFPEVLNNKSKVVMNYSLKRAIYNPMVFTTNMKFDGSFSKTDLSKQGILPDEILWNEASIVIQTTNLKSIKSDLRIKVGDKTLQLESKDLSDSTYGLLESDKFILDPKQGFDFDFDISFNGSNSIQFIPVGKNTTVSIDGDWPSPSFMGSFAAQDDSKKITDKGFHADWKVFGINRPFAQIHKNAMPHLDTYNFGVRLIDTVDEYQQNERVSKYGFLVIGLTFLIFFLIQMVSKVSIHIFQYTMIGLALIMFYTLLISITEHSSFSIAYMVASIAVITMLMLYSYSILKSRRFSIFIASSLSALYVFIYVIIQMEDYALLAGSVGLFAILGSVMYFSRKIEWNS